MCVRPGKMGHRVGFGLAIVPQGPPIRSDGLPKAPKENPGARPGTLLASLTNQRAAAMVMSGDPRTPTVRAGGGRQSVTGYILALPDAGLSSQSDVRELMRQPLPCQATAAKQRRAVGAHCPRHCPKPITGRKAEGPIFNRRPSSIAHRGCTRGENSPRCMLHKGAVCPDSVRTHTYADIFRVSRDND